MKNDLKEIILEVDAILTRYVIIHDTVFKNAWMKIFKRIDHKELRIQAEELIKELYEQKEKLDDISKQNSLSEKEQELADTLLNYIDALTDTLLSLKGILHHLYLRSTNQPSFSWSEYNLQMELYRTMTDKYMNIGLNLNKLYSEMCK